MITAPIVGMRFRPPAPLVLAGLGMEEPLILIREPENTHDENAIKVCLPADWKSRHPELYEEAKEAAESEERDVDWDEPFHLGYIPKEIAASWAPTFDEQNATPPAELIFAPNGGPLVKLLIEEDETEGEEGEPVPVDRATEGLDPEPSEPLGEDVGAEAIQDHYGTGKD